MEGLFGTSSHSNRMIEQFDEEESFSLFDHSNDQTVIQSVPSLSNSPSIKQPITQLAPETDTGNIEYKWKLLSKSATRIEHLTTQLAYRLNEGEGKCLYEIGVLDSGIPEGLSPNELNATINLIARMAKSVNAVATVQTIAKGRHGDVAEIRVERIVTRSPVIHVALMGQAHAGKSTLLGVLKTGVFDNSRGGARLAVSRHRHEIESGRTQSINQLNIQFDQYGGIVREQLSNKLSNQITNQTGNQSTNVSNQVTMIDCVGHVTGRRVTLSALMSGVIEYVGWVVDCGRYVDQSLCPSDSESNDQSANQSISDLDQLKVVSHLGHPMIVILTKIDQSDEQAISQAVKQIEYTANQAHNQVNHQVSNHIKCHVINDVDDPIFKQWINQTINKSLDQSAPQIIDQSILPVFPLSAVSGLGLDVLTRALARLPKLQSTDQPVNQSSEQSAVDSTEDRLLDSTEPTANGQSIDGQSPEQSNFRFGASYTDELNNFSITEPQNQPCDPSNHQSLYQTGNESNNPSIDQSTNDLELSVDSVYEIDGHSVIGGLIVNGTLSVNQSVLIGPIDRLIDHSFDCALEDNTVGSIDRLYVRCVIDTIHVKRCSVNQAYKGEVVSCRLLSQSIKQTADYLDDPSSEQSIHQMQHSDLRRGLVMFDQSVSQSITLSVSRTFCANIRTVDSLGDALECSQYVAYLPYIRQSVRLLSYQLLTQSTHQSNNQTVDEVVDPADCSHCQTFNEYSCVFEFCHTAEYLRVGSKLLIESSNQASKQALNQSSNQLKAVGYVTSIVQATTQSLSPTTRRRKNSKQRRKNTSESPVDHTLQAIHQSINVPPRSNTAPLVCTFMLAENEPVSYFGK